jgi:hypothetical protein
VGFPVSLIGIPKVFFSDRCGDATYAWMRAADDRQYDHADDNITQDDQWLGG